MLAALVVTWAVIPVSPAGYWRGSAFDCLCSSDTVVEFSGNVVTFHQDPWHPLPSGEIIQSDLSGSYTRESWNRYHWLSDVKGSEADYLLHPGWLFMRLTYVPTSENHWAIREWNLSRLRKTWASRE